MLADIFALPRGSQARAAHRIPEYDFDMTHNNQSPRKMQTCMTGTKNDIQRHPHCNLPLASISACWIQKFIQQWHSHFHQVFCF
ncbi:MAG: hypothetical protein LBP52_09080, partial [Burkholderiaceae bacterium]|nr:hypothetical protein [Burkholderiaceae bacterium]